MKPELGLLLPLGLKTEIDDKFQVIELMNSGYIDSLWVRDLPVASLKDKDIGSWYDPFVYLSHLSFALKNPDVKLGIATINCSIRDPIITVKEILSLQMLTKNKLLIGLGTSEKKEILELFNVNENEKHKKLIDFSNFIYKTIVKLEDTDLKGTTFCIPNDIIQPEIGIASSRNIVWESVQGIEHWITYFWSPKEFQKRIDEIKKFSTIKSVTMALNLVLIDEDYLEINQRKGVKCIFTSISKLKELIKIYVDLGVTRFLVSIIESEDFAKDLKSIKEAINSLNI